MTTRVPEMTHAAEGDGRIVAGPPWPPVDPKQPLPVSRTRVWVGVVLFISGFAVGSSSSLFLAAKLGLGIIGLLLIVFSFFVLGLHRLCSRGRHPRKLYEHDSHLTNR
jgi:hypothetical protein